jgi:hypothetical protein
VTAKAFRPEQARIIADAFGKHGVDYLYYKPHILIGSEDIARFRPWIGGFVRAVLRLLGKSAPVEEAAALQRAADDFAKIRLE